MAYDGSIRIQTVIDNKGFRSGRKEIESGLSGIKASLKSLASAIGAAFGAAAVVNFGRESVQAASDLSNALHGLQSIVEGQGRSFEKARAFIQDYISDGLVPMTNAVAAYKNLAARGYSDEQIQQVMLALKDSAAFGRQASYSLGEAVTSATEGLKNENSILVDNAGVTKNVAKMWDDYAKSIGTAANNLTQEQKIQAEVNGILEETRFQTGDAAKVAQSYSGQVSQLTFNFNNLKVAAGNALIPIVQAVLPGLNKLLISLTDILHMAGQVTAALFGTQAAKQEKLASTASKAAKQETALAKATKKASDAAKNAALSIDELNIAQSKENNGSLNDELSSDSLGNSLADSISAGADEIDKISPKAREIADKIRGALKTIKDALSEFAPLLSGITTGFATAFALKWVSGALSKMKKIGGASSLFLGLKKAITATALSFSLAGNPIKAMGAGLRVLGDSLTATQKAMIGLGGSIAVFTTVKDATKDLTMQNIDLGTSMANIIPILGAVGVALYAALGPWGLLAGGIAVAAGAVLGYIEAQNEMREQWIEDSFFDGTGMKLDAFADQFENVTEATRISNQRISEWGSTIESNNTKIDDALSIIDYLTDKMNVAGGKLSEEDVPKMQKALDDLHGSIKENMEASARIVKEVFQKSVSDASLSVDKDIKGISGKLIEFQLMFDKELEGLDDKLKPYLAKLQNGTRLSSQEQAEFEALIKKYEDFGISVSKSSTAFRESIDEINAGKIDFEDYDIAAKKIREIGDQGKTLKNELETAKTESLNAIDTLEAKLENMDLSPEARRQWTEFFSSTRDSIREEFTKKEKEINDQLSGVFGIIQDQLDSRINELAESYDPSWWDKFLAGFLDDYGADYIRESVAAPFADVQAAIDESVKGLQITPNAELGREFFNEMFTYGKNAAIGFQKGAESDQEKARQAGEKLFSAVENGTRRAGGYGSPSKVMKQYGEWADEGFAQGVSSRKNVAVNAFSGLFNAVLDKTDSFCSRFRTAINDALEGMRTAVNSVTISSSGKISYAKMPPVKIPRLATGAVIPPNAQFAAILGDQTHGRNLEAPESLIRQIVREESGGNMDELLDRVEELIDAVRGIELSPVMVADGRVMAEAVSRANRANGYQIVR